MDLTLNLTWLASVLCSVGACLIAVNAYRNKDHMIARNPFFLPLYFAGIIQWVLWGVRIEDPAIIYPCIPQLLILIPLLHKWYLRQLL